MTRIFIPGRHPMLSIVATLRRIVFAVVVASISSIANGSEIAAASGVTHEALFTPGDAVDRRIVALINGARSEVLVQAYSFTHRRIAQALIAAHRRGVRVLLVADRAQHLETPGSVIDAIARAGVDVRLEGRFAAAHNKIVVIDADSLDATVITGSYNYTLAAQNRNAENALVVRHDPPLAQRYRTNFIALRDGAEPYPPSPRP